MNLSYQRKNHCLPFDAMIIKKNIPLISINVNASGCLIGSLSLRGTKQSLVWIASSFLLAKTSGLSLRKGRASNYATTISPA